MGESLIKLKDILKNLKKSPGRTYSEKTINLRLEDIRVITEEFELAQLEEKDEKKIAVLRLEFRNIVEKIKQYLIILNY